MTACGYKNSDEPMMQPSLQRAAYLARRRPLLHPRDAGEEPRCCSDARATYDHIQPALNMRNDAAARELLQGEQRARAAAGGDVHEELPVARLSAERARRELVRGRG